MHFTRAVGEKYVIFDTHPPERGNIDARLDRNDVAGLERRRALHRDAGRLMNLQPQSVTERVAIKLAVPLFGDMSAGDIVEYSCMKTASRDVDGATLRIKDNGVDFLP